MNFSLDTEKAIEASLYVLNNVEGACDFHKLFKVLYFADKAHLAMYGRPITGDQYMAMKDGPVPSFIYDALKSLRGSSDYLTMKYPVGEVFEVADNIYAGPKRVANLDYLSESDIKMLNQSIAENGKLDFFQLREKSHATAWQKTSRNDEMDVIDIAVEAGANIDMVKYIENNIANHRMMASYGY